MRRAIQYGEGSLGTLAKRHGIGRLPEVAGAKEPKRKFRTYPVGCFHSDMAGVQAAEGKLRLFVAIDRTARFASVGLHREGGRTIAARFLHNLVAAVPCAIHSA